MTAKPRLNNIVGVIVEAGTLLDIPVDEELFVNGPVMLGYLEEEVVGDYSIAIADGVDWRALDRAESAAPSLPSSSPERGGVIQTFCLLQSPTIVRVNCVGLRKGRVRIMAAPSAPSVEIGHSVLETARNLQNPEIARFFLQRLFAQGGGW
jgi:hypothetical protein